MGKFKGILAKGRNERQLLYQDDDIVIIGDPRWSNNKKKLKKDCSQDSSFLV